jgi:hypothetical protein
MAVLVSFITPQMAVAVTTGETYINNDSISWSWAVESELDRNVRYIHEFIAIDKAEAAIVLDEIEYSKVRKESGHTFHLRLDDFGDKVFNTALNYIGTPYSYSGSGPHYFDCSGYTSYVFGKFGVDLYHSASTQLYEGKVIPRSQAQLGDLVWMPGHVGFWAGDGLILDAMKPGTRVDIREIWTSYYKIIRIINVDKNVR